MTVIKHKNIHFHTEQGQGADYGRNLWKEPGNTSVAPSRADVHTCLAAIRFAGVEVRMSESAQSNEPPEFDSLSPAADCLRQSAESDRQFWFQSISQKNLSEMVPSLPPCIDRKLARYLQALQSAGNTLTRVVDNHY